MRIVNGRPHRHVRDPAHELGNPVIEITKLPDYPITLPNSYLTQFRRAWRLRELSDGLFQRFAGAEPRHAALRDLDRRAGLRITCRARLAVASLECAESDKRHRIALLQ